MFEYNKQLFLVYTVRLWKSKLCFLGVSKTSITIEIRYKEFFA